MTVNVFEQMPRIIGHRGACGHAPENTLASFDLAATLGAEFIELDVTLSKDNICVIHHDTDLDRCTDGQGPILLKTHEEIKSLDAGSWFSEAFKGERIPTFKETLETIIRLNLGLNLEIKPCLGWQIPTAEHVVNELRRYMPHNLPLLISSFDVECLQAVGAAMPETPLGYLTEAIPTDWERRMTEAGCASLHCQQEFVTEDVVAAVQHAGYRFLAYTVNDVERAQQLLDWGVDGVITDFPDRLLSNVRY